MEPPLFDGKIELGFLDKLTEIEIAAFMVYIEANGVQGTIDMLRKRIRGKRKVSSITEGKKKTKGDR